MHLSGAALLLQLVPLIRLTMSSEEHLHFPPYLMSRSTSPPQSPPAIPRDSPRDHLAEASGQVRLAAAHLTRFRLSWPAGGLPHRFLIVHKSYGQEELVPHLISLCHWLIEDSPAAKQSTPVTVYVDEEFFETYLEQDGLSGILPSSSLDAKDVDLILTMGGDGTVLNAAWLFQLTVPPIMTFHFGTVGFLSMFSFDSFRQDIARVILDAQNPCQHPDETRPVVCIDGMSFSTSAM